MKFIRFKKLLLWFLTFSIGFGSFVQFYAPRFITEPKNPILKLLSGITFSSSASFDEIDSPGRYISYTSLDGLKLVARETFATTGSAKGTLILLHGIGGKKEHFFEASKFFTAHGYNCIAVDLRAHGESEGKYCTFGVKERRNVSSLLDLLEKEDKLDKPIGILGRSLGGAVAIQALATDDRLQFGIVESTFTDMRTITHDYFNYYVVFNYKPLSDYFVDRAGVIGNFNPDDADPNRYCKQIKRPVLIVHGKKDDRINIKYAEANFKNLNNPASRFFIIQKASHLNVWEVGSEMYKGEVLRFIEANTENTNVKPQIYNDFKRIH